MKVNMHAGILDPEGGWYGNRRYTALLLSRDGAFTYVQ